MLVPSPAPSDEDFLLILHSSCSIDEQPTQNIPKNGLVPSSNQNASGDPPVEELPIVCDFLILPEDPSPDHRNHNEDNTSHSDVYMTLRNKELNPCGFSNVLMLQGVSDWEGLLLSLTSCRIVTAANITLPVGPTPSTFDVSLKGGNKNKSSMAELNVQFDLTVARNMPVGDALPSFHTLATEDTNPERKISLEGTDTPLATPGSGPEKSDIRDDPPRSDKNCELKPDLTSVHGFYLDMCIAPLQAQYRPQPDTSFERRVEQLLLLQDRLDKEAAYWDSIFLLLAILGMVLLGLLIWTILKLHRPEKEDKTIELARLSLKRKLLSLGSDDLEQLARPASHDVCSEANVNTSPPRIAVSAAKLSPRRMPKKEDKPYHPMEPVCLNSALEEAACHLADNLNGSTQDNLNTSRVQTPIRSNRTIVLPAKPQTGMLRGVTKTENSIDELKIPSQTLTEDMIQKTPPRVLDKKEFLENSKEAGRTQEMPVVTRDISPCSKLALQWAATKSKRRNNRMRKLPFLQPNDGPSKAGDAPGLDISTTRIMTTRRFLEPIGSDEVIGPPSVRLMSTGNGLCPQMALAHPDKRYLKPTSHCSSSIVSTSLPNFKGADDSKTTNGPAEGLKQRSREDHTPPLSSAKSSAALPELCSTPASDDGDSFVDDYW